jgi:hypothetical protein
VNATSPDDEPCRPSTVSRPSKSRREDDLDSFGLRAVVSGEDPTFLESSKGVPVPRAVR